MYAGRCLSVFHAHKHGLLNLRLIGDEQSGPAGMARGGRLERRVPARLTAKEGRKFAFTLFAAFGILGGIVLWRGHETVAYVFLGLSGTLLLAGLIAPTYLGPVERGMDGSGCKDIGGDHAYRHGHRLLPGSYAHRGGHPNNREESHEARGSFGDLWVLG